MRIKHYILTLAIVSLMVLSSLFVVSDSYAYWRGDVIGSSDTATATVTTGEWNQAFEWDPDATYQAGDLVTNNGVTYEAKRDNPTREPGVGGGWRSDWTAL